ncbi:MAG: zinc ribbon domain-containing protein [Verrucomicrobiae bacterium]|nr:zinc ribbon domain-containing protein [Verrucomicrobiae bacterium]
MPTYIYETIPEKTGRKIRRFEVKQSMKDAPLERDPETGLPVRRVISGGLAPLLSSGESNGDCGNGRCEMPSPAAHTCGSMCGCTTN